MARVALIIGIMLLAFTPENCLASDQAQLCFNEAGYKYNIAPELLKAIAKVESHFTINAINTSNRNGSVDFCHMQVNSWWKSRLGENWEYLTDPCYCTMVGAWILRQCFDQYGNNWDAVACYNTGKSTQQANGTKKTIGQKYIGKVQLALAKIKRSTP